MDRMADFSTPVEIIRWAISRITGDIQVPGFFARRDVRSRLAAAFEAAHLAGNSRQAQKEIVALLDGYAWRWPMFDDAAAHFRGLGIWPKSWLRHDIRPDSVWEDIPLDTRVMMLVRTTDHACYTGRTWRDWNSLAKDGMWHPTWRRHLLPINEDCPAETLMVERHHTAIEALDKNAPLPPYFPGDGTHIRMKTGRRR